MLPPPRDVDLTTTHGPITQEKPRESHSIRYITLLLSRNLSLRKQKERHVPPRLAVTSVTVPEKRDEFVVYCECTASRHSTVVSTLEFVAGTPQTGRYTP